MPCSWRREAGKACLGQAARRSWTGRREEELGNLRAALTWAREQREAEVGLRLIGVWWWYWDARGPLDEGIAWAEALLAVDAAESRARRATLLARARALFGLATLKGR